MHNSYANEIDRSFISFAYISRMKTFFPPLLLIFSVKNLQNT